MSEFTEVYYLAAATQDDGAALLEAARLSGWIFPPSNGWVAVVPDTPFRGSPSDDVVRNLGLTAYFVHAEDHGWGLFVWHDGSSVWEYQCSWDPTVDINRPHSAGDLGRLLGRYGISIDEAALDDALHPSSVEDVISRQPARAAAMALQLPHHDWMQAGYLASDDSRAALASFVEHGSADLRSPDLEDWELQTKTEMTPDGFPLPPDATYFVASSGVLVTLALGLEGDVRDRVAAMASALEQNGYSVGRGLDNLDPQVLGALARDSGLARDEFLARSSEAGGGWLAWQKADDLGAVSFVKTPPQRGIPPMVLSVYWLRSP